MSIKNIYAAESWEKVYQAFSQVNFTAYDYETIKLSILDYLRLYYPENFNDYIESSELIALIESFAYVAEQLAYRVDMLSHENFITTAQRKQSILKLAKLISYKPSRNIPARGLVKITSISTTESIIDSQGNNLAGNIIVWNDPNNPNWKEQFLLVINRTISGKFGQYSGATTIGNVNMQLYGFNNTLNSVKNGIISFTGNNGLESFPMEIVPILLNENGPYEKTPDINSQLSFVYSNDGLGDGSDYTGFLMYVKQGILSKIEHDIADIIPNRQLTLTTQNVNETDVWVTEVNSSGTIQNIWEQVEVMADQNLTFNTIKNRKKYEVETLENDSIKLIFGDGDFSDIPVGKYYIWTRQSVNKSINIPANKIVNQPVTFQYSSTSGLIETCNFTFSLTSTIQNSAATESIEHIRQSAPATYYAQNRMVNAQDYNTYMLKDQSILRLMSINRTFAGQPKYLEWNDASGQYQNIKLFGDDLELSYSIGINSINTGSAVSSRNLIDEVIEPLLSSTGIMNLLSYIKATDPVTAGMVTSPRRIFIEDKNISKLEKTLLQGVIDGHWYGEPSKFVKIGNISYALINDPSDSDYPKEDGYLWLDSVPRTIDGINPYIPGDIGSGTQTTAWQSQFGLYYENFSPLIGTNYTISGSINSRVKVTNTLYKAEVFTIEFTGNGKSFNIFSNLRGKIGSGQLGIIFSSPSINILINQNIGTSFYSGDAFKISLSESTVPDAISFSESDSFITGLNLNGSWKIINGNDLTSTPNSLAFNPTLAPNSWVIWVKAILNPVTNQPTNFIINYRELKLLAYSKNTKFWFNSNEQLLDSETKNVVFDLIRVLRSNLTYDSLPLGHNENYDVVGPIYNSLGEIQPNYLEVIPTDMLKIDSSGDTIPDNILQFINFTGGDLLDSNSYVYYKLNLGFKDGPEISADDFSAMIYPNIISDYFTSGSFISTQTFNNFYYGRILKRTSLDFMWQHFTPYNNLIDPSVSNIHDMYILTQGYYNAIAEYLQGKTSIVPQPPTSLDLRNQYNNLLQNKMLSDTVVLHSAKIKLLFGALAEPQLRAIFKIVKTPNATMSNERLKTEVLNVINTYFNIQNWDFGSTFFATELYSLIHQRLPSEIASVVLVPVYAINSFGSLFQIDSGLDEILQSAATLHDIEIVSELNSTILKQGIIS